MIVVFPLTLLYFLVVKLFVHFDLLSLNKNGQRLALKSLFTPTLHKIFLVSNKRHGQNKTFLLQCYAIDFALIKRYSPFCFYDCIQGSKDSPLLSLSTQNQCIFQKRKFINIWKANFLSNFKHFTSDTLGQQLFYSSE